MTAGFHTKPQGNPRESKASLGTDELALAVDEAVASQSTQPDPAQDSAPLSPVQEYGYRFALMVVGLLALAVFAALPLAIHSMASSWFGERQHTLYDLAANSPVSPVASTESTTNRNFFTLAVVNLDPATNQATLAVSGNRTCAQNCAQFDVTIFALDDNAAERRGVPPSATITIEPTEQIFSESITLPVRGQPSLYPFDTYDLWLGFAISVTMPGGQRISVNREMVQRQASVTLENQEPTLLMDAPTQIDPSLVQAPSDPFRLPLVVGLHFVRPDYVKLLAVMLIALISISGGMALVTRGIEDLVLGIGGIILGVWGIRSILINQPLPGLSAIDVALSFVILFMLFGLTVRVLRYLHDRGNWSRLARGRSSSG